MSRIRTVPVLLSAVLYASALAGVVTPINSSTAAAAVPTEKGVTGHFATPSTPAAAPPVVAEKVTALQPGKREFSPAELATAQRTGSTLTVVDGVGIRAATDITGVTVAVTTASSANGVPAGPVVTITATDRSQPAPAIDVVLSTSMLKSFYGADYASRVTWQQSPATAPANIRALATTRAWGAQTVRTRSAMGTVKVTAAGSGTIDNNGAGDFRATSLSPSGSWNANIQTGDFTWTYPFDVPQAADGSAPNLGLTYDSGSIDGRTSATNNQTSAIGEGWQLTGGGFIERSYAGCADDTTTSSGTPSPTTGDQCWATNNAALSMDGRNGQLLSSDGASWHLETDDGSTIERMTGANNGTHDGEYWVVTDTTGVRYFFGLNDLTGKAWHDSTTGSAWTVPVVGNKPGEPCYGEANNTCINMGYRWNLDYVVDPHGNATAFYYTPETNSYGRNNDANLATAYTRGGLLKRVDYGMSESTPAVQPAQRAVLKAADRCLSSDCAVNANWKDTPLDLTCAGAPCTQHLTPSFWTKYRVAAVTTQVLTKAGYSNVDKWTLGHQFEDPQDNSSPVLRLDSIGHTGLVGSTSNALVTSFVHRALPNRVYRGADGLSFLNRFRISKITQDTGAVLSVNYSDESCGNPAPTEQTNSSNCFPQWWAPVVDPPLAPRKDWFNKYVVTSISDNPIVGDGDPDEYQYNYIGAAGWRYDTTSLLPDADSTRVGAKRTWNIFAGFAAVETRHGTIASPSAQQVTRDYFYRGLDGNRSGPNNTNPRAYSTTAPNAPAVTDFRWLRGQVRAHIEYGPGGSYVMRTVNDPWYAATVTDADGRGTSYLVADGTSTRYTALTGPTRPDQVTQTTVKHEGIYGRVVSVEDLGITTDSTDDVCTTVSYPAVGPARLLSLTSETTTVSVSCSATPTTSDTVSDTRFYYDGATSTTAAPTKGEVTKTEQLKGYAAGGSPQWLTVSTATYDSIGRQRTSQDALNRKTATDYTEDGYGRTTSVVTTNPLLWQTTRQLSAERGQTTSVTDPNGRVTTVAYDSLGRIIKVWRPDRTPGQQTPSYIFAYTQDGTNPLAVATTALTPTGGTRTSYQITDMLGRPRQTQRPAVGGGMLVTDTLYDGAGRAYLSNAEYFVPGANPQAALFVSNVPLAGQTRTEYDVAGRKTAEVLFDNGSERWRTRWAYRGDHVDTTPPEGGTPTSTWTDAHGRTTRLDQYDAATPTGTVAATTGYTYNGRGDMVGLTDATTKNRWTWSFDLLGRNIASTDPDSGPTTKVYDDAGQLTTSKDARNQALVFTYDKLGRKTAEYDTTTTGTLLASWTYDRTAKSRGLPYQSVRYVGGSTGAQYVQSVDSYDPLDRPLTTSTTIPTAEGSALAGTYAVTTSYNPDGSIATTSLPTEGGLPAETISTGYDQSGNIIKISTPITTYLTKATYSKTDELQQTLSSFANNYFFKDYSYDDAARRLTEATVTTRDTSNVTRIVSDRSYGYNPVGDITSISDAADGLATDKQCFSYDYLRRLTEAWTPTQACSTAPASATMSGPAPYWNTYTYDITGNRTKLEEHAVPATSTPASTATYTYPTPGGARPHAVTAITTVAATTSQLTYGYQPNGNLDKVNGTTVNAYDAEGHLATSNTVTGSSSEITSADGDRLVHTDSINGKTVYLGNTELHLGAGQSVVTAVRTYKLGTQPFLVRYSSTTGSVSMIPVDADHQATETARINYSTLNATHRYFDPFGDPRGTASAPWIINQQSFLGGPADQVAGTVHLGARDYAAPNGRFTSPDPLLRPFDPQSLNAYAYAMNNPVSTADPDGREPAPANCTSTACRNAMYGGNGSNPYAATPKGNCQTTNSGDAAACALAGTHQGPNPRIVRANSISRKNQYLEGATTNLDWGGIYDPVRVIGGNIACYGKEACRIAYLYSQDHPNDIDGAVEIAANYCFDNPDACQSSSDKAEIAQAFVGGLAILVAPRLGAADTAGDGAAGDLAKAGCGESFSAETQVVMADGSTKPLDQVRVGDKVEATDTQTGKTTAKTVTAVMVNHDTDLMDVTIKSGGKASTIQATQHHLFWDQSRRAWVEADQLATGDRLRTDDGIVATVASAVVVPGAADRWDLTVADDHDFYVVTTTANILVHNCRAPWSLTKDGSSATMRGGPMNTAFYQSKADGTWWTVDTAGHGGSAFKVYERTSTGLQWINDADQYGDYISGKWKGGTGYFIPNSTLSGG